MKHLLTIAVLLIASTASAVEPVAFLACPREPGYFSRLLSVSQSDGPYQYEPGTDLNLLNPDGTERLVVKGEATVGERHYLAVVDFCPSLDGKSIYYAHVWERADTRPYTYCDIFRIDLATAVVVQLTDARNEFSPPRGVGRWIDGPIEKSDMAWTNEISTHPVWNTSPCDTPKGIVFTTNRHGVRSPKEQFAAMQLARIDHDGKNYERIGHLNLGGAAHPTLGPDGRVYFSSGEQQGYNIGEGNNWAMWSILPDGTDWQPEISRAGFTSKGKKPEPWHFQTHLSDGTLVADRYYDTAIYGTFFGAPPYRPSPFDPPTHFGDPLWNKNPLLANGQGVGGIPHEKVAFPFQRRGFYPVTPWAGDQDGGTGFLLEDGVVKDIPKVIHPCGTVGNSLLLTANGFNGSLAMDLGCYKIPDGRAGSAHPRDLVKLVDRDDRHEWMPRPAVEFKAIYGADPPTPTSPRSTSLPPGSPYGEIGTSSMKWREITEQWPNTSPDTSPVMLRGPDEDIEWLRLISFNPTLTYKVGSQWSSPTFPKSPGFMHIRPTPAANGNQNSEGFWSQANERMGFYEQLIPLKKWRKADGSVHLGANPPSGSTRIMLGSDPDSSFRAYVPADQPFTFQLLNAKAEAILGATAQTWHQVRPGEKRVNCNGCHAHNRPAPMSFDETFAASAEYTPLKLDKIVTVEWFRDIKPILDPDGSKYGDKPDLIIKAAMMYQSAASTLDDNPAFSESQRRLVRAWIDTGLMVAGKNLDGTRVAPASQGGPYADAVDPTLALTVFTDRILIGACDPQSGLSITSLSVMSDKPMAGKEAGQELAALGTWAGDVWTLATAVPDCTLTVSIRDNQRAKNSDGVEISVGNIAKIVRTVSPGSSPPPPPPPDQSAEIAALKTEIQKLKSEGAVMQAQIVELQNRIAAAKAALGP